MSTATTANGSVKRDLTRKPPRLPIIAQNIPPIMRETKRWVGWRWEADAEAGKWNKPPIDVRRDRRGSSTNSATWCDFATALAAAESGFVDGVGFALGDGFCGVDFDNCRDRGTGDIAPDVLAYIRRLSTYGEVSPSGEGVKLILRGTLPKGRRANGKVEVYDHGRYFTVTGHRLDGCPSDLASNDVKLAALHRELIEAPQTVSQHRRESRMDDRELAIAALGGLSPARADTYHDWLLVGMALHAADAGLVDAWDSWSQHSPKYAAGCCADKWQSFNGSAVGLGSLIHWAGQDTGWTPPRHIEHRKKNEPGAPTQRAPKAAGTPTSSRRGRQPILAMPSGSPHSTPSAFGTSPRGTSGLFGMARAGGSTRRAKSGGWPKKPSGRFIGKWRSSPKSRTPTPTN